MGHEYLWKPLVQAGPYLVQNGAHTGGFTPEAVVREEVPDRGGVAVGQKGQLDGFAVMGEGDGGKGLIKGGGYVHAASAQSAFHDGHAARAVVVAGNCEDLAAEAYQTVKNCVK